MKRRTIGIFLALLVPLLLRATVSADTLFADGKVVLGNRATLSFEYDDNVYKSQKNVEDDGLARLYYDLKLNFYPNVENILLVNYQGGAKKYFQIEEQDTLVNLFRLGYTNRSLENSFLGTDASFKMRNIRSGEEDFNKLIAELYAGHEFEKGIVAQIRGGYTLFDFQTYDYYDYWLHRYGLIVQKSFGTSFNFAVHFFFQEKHFPFNAYNNLESKTDDVFLSLSNRKRRDILFEPALFIQFYKWLLFDFSYTMQINQSNSYGDSYYNHRLSVGLSKTIFKNTNLHLFGVAQFRDSNEKVLIPHSYSIEEDDENYNTVAAKLSHRFTDYVSLEVGYSRYWTAYSTRDINFVKNLYSVGVAFNF